MIANYEREREREYVDSSGIFEGFLLFLFVMPHAGLDMLLRSH